MKRATGGGYILVMNISQPAEAQIGKLGLMDLKPGTYYYGGSAQRGINARIQRHFSKEKKAYWHIDYLTSHPAVDVKEAWCYPDFSTVEHQLADCESLGNDGILKGFGNGDCTAGCSSHLWKGKRNLVPEDFAENYYIETNYSKSGN